MTKDLFIESIEAIKRQRDHDRKCHKAFSTLLPYDYVSGYDHHWLLSQLIKLLQKATGQGGDHCWIEYYIWECDFGRNSNTDSVKIDGIPVPFSTASDLWDVIHSL